MSQQSIESPPTDESHQIPTKHITSEEVLPSKIGDDTKKRKPTKPRSKVWEHFTKFNDESGAIKGKCNHCGKDFFCDPKKNGTTALNNHLKTCKKCPQNMDSSQKELCMQPRDDGEASVNSWKFDQQAIRMAIAEMVIVDEYPFRVVESRSFKKVMNTACPRYKMLSRWTTSRDCYQIYLDERAKLKKFMKDQRICITTDTWTSIQKMNYMVITAHFIDSDWKLHKKIINFCPISSHSGDSLGKILSDCLLEWGVDKVFTVTVDNHSANEIACKFLKKKFENWGTCIAEGKFLHMRCIAHILNLIVNDGLKEVSWSIKWVRRAVRYIRQSPARLNKFKECAENTNIQCTQSLKLDVATRWNSTYEMLNVAEKYEKTFEAFEAIDPYFKLEVEAYDGEGTPFVDWLSVRRLRGMLEHFYDATLRISGSLYVTSNSFWSEISDLLGIILQWTCSDDLSIKRMGVKMKEKFDKYWGDPKKMNKLIFISCVIDPREKFDAMQVTFCKIYGDNDGIQLFEGVKDALYELFDAYTCIVQPENTRSHSSGSSSMNLEPNVMERVGSKRRPGSVFKQEFKRQQNAEGVSVRKKSELDLYLEEALQEDRDDFDILRWWRINFERFPVLATMAKDVLAVPISTVASESAFSTGRRVLDCFRSSLTPKVVESLICAQDWLRNGIPLKNEEDLEEVENFEKDLPIIGFGGNGASFSGNNAIGSSITPLSLDCDQ